MAIAYFNGAYLSPDQIRISPDERGFLFADGVYEVARRYNTHFFAMSDHLVRLKRSLAELRIEWDGADEVPQIADELIRLNDLDGKDAIFYIQVTRGSAKRSHSFPNPPVAPTVYAFVREFKGDSKAIAEGVRVYLTEDIRWGRCDIKSIALLANVLGYQKAHEEGCTECVFVKDGVYTEGAHTNLFFVMNGALYTFPSSGNILNGISRQYVIKMAVEAGIEVVEEAVAENMKEYIHEAFLAGTTVEITPITSLGDFVIRDGIPGPVTKLIQEKFYSLVASGKAM